MAWHAASCQVHVLWGLPPWHAVEWALLGLSAHIHCSPSIQVLRDELVRNPQPTSVSVSEWAEAMHFCGCLSDSLPTASFPDYLVNLVRERGEFCSTIVEPWAQWILSDYSFNGLTNEQKNTGTYFPSLPDFRREAKQMLSHLCLEFFKCIPVALGWTSFTQSFVKNVSSTAHGVCHARPIGRRKSRKRRGTRESLPCGGHRLPGRTKHGCVTSG